ncbi:CheR family methyltransferase [Pseudoduganella namucuonensis]|uniref:Chemotaxis protein methyltransferase n=1 Tax=Pseudoduganella namucuonensis TaxID=1035707 RepID=A0A1I7M7L0_9BURK|nr:protein-glutamate O-methyltransferase CheR [Pseudoduganella namucuonensis]SFV17877.1 chemotaxis protein methyltransferase CheR [Pseudoduganella namucuonensis]
MRDAAATSVDPITDQEFTLFQRFIFEEAGITLSPAKKALVSGRLAKRLLHHRLGSYSAYFRLLTAGQAPGEVQIAIDLLTTNETYFFRESKHFDLLRKLAAGAAEQRQSFRVWSAACSTGEEPYSIAMVLDDVLREQDWELYASDISSRVLSAARSGHYMRERTSHIPPAYLKRYCLRGVGDQEGTLLVEKRLRQRVQFHQVNLNETLPKFGTFDVIFLRNVLIYFSPETKREVVGRLLGAIKPGGHLLIGHSESLHDMAGPLQVQGPSVYRKV